MPLSALLPLGSLGFLLLSPALASGDRSLEALNNEGVRHYEAREYHQAIRSFEKALELDPANADVRANLAGAWSGLGVEFLNSGESRSAEEAFEKSLRIHADFYASFGLGYILFLRMDDDGAREALDASLKLRPDFSKAHKILALIDYRHGREDEAYRRIDRAATLDSTDREASAIRDRWRVEAEVVKSFREVKTEGFRVRHDPVLSRARVDALLEHLGACRAAIGGALGRESGRTLTVILFREESFRRATGARHWIGGVFDGQIKVPVVLDRDGFRGVTTETLRALQHELSHALIKEVYPGCPNWLNEGVAQFFELYPVPRAGVSRAEAERQAGQLRARRRELVERRLRNERERRVAFAKIPARLWDISSESEARWTYLQGLGFVEFLAGKHHIFRLRLLLETARAERSLKRAFTLTYGQELSVLEDAWWRTLLE